MKYKHDEVIRAWLDGKTVQVLSEPPSVWNDIPDVGDCCVMPIFSVGQTFRIKPEPKPDVVRYVNVYLHGIGCDYRSVHEANLMSNPESRVGVVKYTIDGETGKLKSAEVV